MLYHRRFATPAGDSFLSHRPGGLCPWLVRGVLPHTGVGFWGNIF